MASTALKRDVYVPAPRAAVVTTTAAAPPLPHELAVRAAGDVFRGVPWDGKAPAEEEPPVSDAQPSATAIGLHQPAAVAFGSIPWTGSRPEAPTGRQLEKSVGNILAQFNWE